MGTDQAVAKSLENYRTFVQQLSNLLALPPSTLEVSMTWQVGNSPPEVTVMHLAYWPDGQPMKDDKGRNVVQTSKYAVRPKAEHFTYS